MTAPERFADSQIPLAPRAPSIHDPQETCEVFSVSIPEIQELGQPETLTPCPARAGRFLSLLPSDFKRFA